MAARGRDDDKPFLSRWSQRKRQAVEEDAAAAAQADAETAAEPTVAPEAVDPATLPDIDALDVGADFTVFMREGRSAEHTSELQSLMRNSYAVFCLKKKQKQRTAHAMI